MGNPKIKKPHEQKSELENYLNRKASVSDEAQNGCFNISLKHFDREQSDDFTTWQTSGYLASVFDVLSNYCQRPLRDQFSKKFTVYGNFPPKNKTIYYFPKHVPEDAEWARIHVDGTHILAGHIFKNTFFLVFLDPIHGFYKSELKHT